MDLRCCRHSFDPSPSCLWAVQLCPLLTVHPPLKGPPTSLILCLVSLPRLQASRGQDCIFSFHLSSATLSAWHVAEFREGCVFIIFTWISPSGCPRSTLNSRWLDLILESGFCSTLCFHFYIGWWNPDTQSGSWCFPAFIILDCSVATNSHLPFWCPYFLGQEFPSTFLTALPLPVQFHRASSLSPNPFTRDDGFQLHQGLNGSLISTSLSSPVVAPLTSQTSPLGQHLSSNISTKEPSFPILSSMNRTYSSSQRSACIVHTSICFTTHIQPIHKSRFCFQKLLPHCLNLICLDSFLNSVGSLLICLSIISLPYTIYSLH